MTSTVQRGEEQEKVTSSTHLGQCRGKVPALHHTQTAEHDTSLVNPDSRKDVSDHEPCTAPLRVCSTHGSMTSTGWLRTSRINSRAALTTSSPMGFQSVSGWKSVLPRWTCRSVFVPPDEAQAWGLSTPQTRTLATPRPRAPRAIDAHKVDT